MKFLLDQDVYAVRARFLRGGGHDVVTAAELGCSQATDFELWWNRAGIGCAESSDRDRDGNVV